MSTNDADSPMADPTAGDVPAADETAAPKRRRAPRKKAEAAPAPADAGGYEAPSAAQVFGSAEAPPAAPVAEAPPPVPVDATPAAAAGEAAPAGAEAPAADGDGAPRRSRNRRRGRRGGDRGPRVEGDTAAAPAEAGAEPDDDETDADAEGAEARPPRERVPPADVGEVFAEVLSGAYDAEPAVEEAEAAATKRVLAPEPDAPKLHKVLAQAGVGSRRDMEQMILEGRITVNGEPAHIGQRISFGDRIAVGGKPVRVRIAPPPPRVLAYHKPAGEVVTHDDPQQRPTVFRRLPRLQQGKWQSVGRLDINTEGLLLFTNSGELANQLMHPRFGVEREYAVRSLGVLGEEAKARLLEGVDIDGQRCAFKSITDGGGEGANHWYRCVITEGRNREVRKLFETVGHAVSRLIRIRYGSVVLPRGLKRGVWVDLDEQDVRSLRRIAGAGQPQPGAQGRPGAERGPDRGEPRGDRDEGGRNKRRGKRGRGPRPDGALPGGGGEVLNIPNPLQQTFDKRAIQQERRQAREIPEDGPIPNPLQQTYDKRALQQDRQPRRDIPEDGPIPNPLQQTYDKRFTQKPRGFGSGGSGQGGGGGGGGGGQRSGRKGGGGGGGGGERQPDPLKTAVGYIGGDAFLRKGGGGGGRGGGGRRGGGGGGRGGR
jgi:23S rRNA pseudouridine2605 synthase